MDIEELGLRAVNGGCPVEADFVPLIEPSVGAVVESRKREELLLIKETLDLDFGRDPPADRAWIVIRLHRGLDGAEIPEFRIRFYGPVERLFTLGVELALVAFQLPLLDGDRTVDHLRNGCIELGVGALSVEPSPLVELAVRISDGLVRGRLIAAVDRCPDDTVLFYTLTEAYSVLDIGIGIEGVADAGVVGLDFIAVGVCDKEGNSHSLFSHDTGNDSGHEDGSRLRAGYRLDKHARIGRPGSHRPEHERNGSFLIGNSLHERRGKCRWPDLIFHLNRFRDDLDPYLAIGIIWHVNH